MAKKKLSKNQRRRLKKKAQKAQKRKEAEQKTEEVKENVELAVAPVKVEVQYISSEVRNEVMTNDTLAQFRDIFSKFNTPEELTAVKQVPKEEDEDTEKKKKMEVEEKEEEEEKAVVVLSKRKRKILSRLSVAQLKQLVKRPDVVEVHDVTAADPRLLVYLKSYRNTVPVPRHWLRKRKYLQGKRGIEKPPFQLPECIAMTGIAKIRGAAEDKEDSKGMKSKARANMSGKTGKMDIDYQVLYNAFFKYQTKPENMTIHGNIYYEMKEFEVKLENKKPGILSDALKTALGMPEGAPPPWLINMQRYGPPPSYPKLKIPGLNAPIPAGATLGYHPGGWGKPPVDEIGRPLYGDVFGEGGHDDDERPPDAERWGELEAESEEEEEEEAEPMDEEEEMMEDDTETGIETPGLISGTSSVSSGLQTPDTIDLRKGTRSVSSVGTDTPNTPQLYTVLKEKATSVGSAMFGSNKQYVVPLSKPAGTGTPENVAEGDGSRKRKNQSSEGGKSKKSKGLQDFKF